MLKRLLGASAAAVLVLSLAACGSDDGGDGGDDTAADTPSSGAARTHAPQPENPDGAACQYPVSPSPVETRDAQPPAETAAYDGDVAATIETSAGDVPITLDAASAPCTVNSFTSLASQGYFDDTECHRLTGGGSLSVLQCGDPSATGGGGPGYSFADELDSLPAPDPTTGAVDYPAGTLAMANAGPNTNGSQFFIVYADSMLGPDYTVFGSVDQAGIDVVADVAADGTDNANGVGDGAPNTPVTIEFVDIAG